MSMEFRVRERMGKFRYTFMPWQRQAVLEQLETLDAIEAEMEKAGVPYTPGRLPEWK